MILVEEGRCETQSQAVLAILSQLPAPWRWLRVLRWIPRRVRDSAYDLVARRRIRWFGRRSTCLTSLSRYGNRFLEF